MIQYLRAPSLARRSQFIPGAGVFRNLARRLPARPRPCNPLWTLSDYFVINCGSLHVVTATYKTPVQTTRDTRRPPFARRQRERDNARQFPALFKKKIAVVVAQGCTRARGSPRSPRRVHPAGRDSHTTYLFIYQRPYNRPRRQGCCASTWPGQIASGRLYISGDLIRPRVYRRQEAFRLLFRFYCPRSSGPT